MTKTYICPNPNCSYQGTLSKKAKGNIFVFLLLFMIGIIPGLIYLILKNGVRYYCPKCNLEIKNIIK